MKKINYKEKGITLVALVITIIILLILAGVTISTALGQNGLFQRAKIAGEKYKESEEQEQSKLDDIVKEIDKIEEPNIEIDYNDYIGAYVKGYETQSKSITISKETSGIEDKYFSTREIDDKGNQKNIQRGKNRKGGHDP